MTNARAFAVLVLCAVCNAADFPKVDVDAYCKLFCGKEQSTICKYKCEVGGNCTEMEFYPLSLQERELILEKHNEVRQKVASGGDTRGEQGSSTNMLAFNYGMQLEEPAMCWAFRCTFGHDVCRKTPKFRMSVGQNLYMIQSGFPKAKTLKDIIGAGVRSWYNEIEYMSKELTLKFNKHPTKMIGHYVQLVWSSTRYLGCIRVTFRCPGKGPDCHVGHMFCNYGPSGNVQNMPAYEYGEPASKCPRGTKPNKKYPALCGEIKKITLENTTIAGAEQKKKKKKPSSAAGKHVSLLAFVASLSLLLGCYI